MLKKILVLFITLSFLCPSVIKESYTLSKYSDETNYVKSFLISIKKDSNISEPIELSNFNNSLEALAFNIDSGGYIILNTNDYNIVEMSFDNSSPYDKNDSNYYNGPLQYYAKENDKYISIMDNNIVNIENIETFYHTKKEPYLISLKKQNLSTYDISRSLDVEKHLNGSLSQWYVSGNNCGSIACAIMMKYYDAYIDGNYVDSAYESKNNLIALMQQYVGSGSTMYSSIVGGLTQYFFNKNINNTCNVSSGFSFSLLMSKINNNRPLIYLMQNHPSYGNHYVIAHGYFNSDINGKYMIINDGWGRNNVWINSNNTYVYKTIYLGK